MERAVIRFESRKAAERVAATLRKLREVEVRTLHNPVASPGEQWEIWLTLQMSRSQTEGNGRA